MENMANLKGKTLAAFVEELQARGRYTFTRAKGASGADRDSMTWLEQALMADPAT